MPQLGTDKSQAPRRCPATTTRPEKWDWDWHRRPVSAFPADRVESLFKKIDTALSFAGAPSSCSLQDSKVMASAPRPRRATIVDAKEGEGKGEEGHMEEMTACGHTGLASDALLTQRVR